MRTFWLMALGVLAVSTSGPMMAAMVVPPLAIAFWRNALATAVLVPGSVRRRGELRVTDRRTFLVVAASGLALAVHFGTWVTSVTMTSVASATALVCLQIGWVAAWQMLRGERFDASVTTGLVVAFAGVLVVSGVDLQVSTRALAGDGLALVGGLAAAAYMVLGARARRTMTTTTYTFVCYGVCAATLALACLVAGQPLTGFPAEQWGLLVAVTVVAQLLGHSVFNHLLATTSPMVVSLALLLEVPGAALLAAAFLGQTPPVTALLGLLVILLGMGMVVLNRGPDLAEPPVS